MRGTVNGAPTTSETVHLVSCVATKQSRAEGQRAKPAWFSTRTEPFGFSDEAHCELRRTIRAELNSGGRLVE
jgi:hypothetical protein